MTIAIPSVLSFQRGTIISDGLLSSIINKDGREFLEPIRVIRHGIRGTNSHPKDGKNGGLSNIQRTESAKTSTRAEGLAVKFSLRTINANSLLFGCSDIGFRNATNGFVEEYFHRNSLELNEICCRYARNILNGRWLWRNRILGEVSVVSTGGNKKFTSAGSRFNDFDAYTEDEKGLASVIIGGFLAQNGSGEHVIEVEGRVIFGFTGEVEVFPSQNMVSNKPDGFARSLYKVDMISRKDLMAILGGANKDKEDAGEFMADAIDMGHAAIRDQKIGNAIRTIDNWYPSFAETNLIIPVEPNGASLELNKVLRDKSHESGTFLAKIDEYKQNSDFNQDAAFLIATMIRGGVFSNSKEAK